jgi:DNA-binding MarR family transcriptional regulator
MLPIEDSVGYQLIHLLKEHRQRAEEALSKLGLHAAQEFILFLLWREDGISQSRMAASLRLELPTITKAVQRMERVGLVVRRQDVQDSRVSRVYLTEQGRSLYEPALQVWLDLEARTLQGLTEAEKALFRRIVQQAVANLS